MDGKPSRRVFLIIGAACAAVAIAAVVAVALYLLVFSDDTNTARELVGRAMPHMAIVQGKLEELAPEIDSLVNDTPNMGSGAEYHDAAAGIREQVRLIEEELDGATIEYNRISGLKGLEEYKEYARIAMQLVRNDHRLAAQVTSYLDDIEAAIAEAGGSPSGLDPDSYYKRSSEFITMFNGLRGDAASLKERAEKLRAAL